MFLFFDVCCRRRASYCSFMIDHDDVDEQVIANAFENDRNDDVDHRWAMDFDDDDDVYANYNDQNDRHDDDGDDDVDDDPVNVNDRVKI